MKNLEIRLIMYCNLPFFVFMVSFWVIFDNLISLIN